MIENDKHIDPRVEKIWRFVRGDMKVHDFEQWLYSDQSLEEMLGKTLYLEIISVNYSDKDALFKTKKRLSEHARNTAPYRCKCIELADTDVVNMGEESELALKYMVRVKERGEPFWWLSLEECKECNQRWLMASEERQNDLYCFRRLDNKTVDEIINKNIWPDYFDKYETLLRLGYDAGISYRFVDPMNSSLLTMITDLAKERPGIAIPDIAKLLNIDIALAKELAKISVKKDGVQIALEN